MAEIDGARARPAGFRRLTQYALPALTVTATTLTSLRRPEYGLLVGLASQTFWLYTGWIAWRERREAGILVNSIIILAILCVGVANYWLPKVA